MSKAAVNAFPSMPDGDVRVVVPDGFTVSSLDAAAAAGMVEGSLPRILKHYATVKAAFGAERAAYIDGLQRLANETQDAHLQVTLSDAAGSLGALHAEVLHEHALLLSDAVGLVHRKLLERNAVAPCRPTRGFRTTAASTLRLVRLFRERWAQVSERTVTKLADVDRAEAKALQMRQRVEGERFVAVFFGVMLSTLALLLDELSFHIYPRRRDLLVLFAVGVLENFGYRQINVWWRVTGIWQWMRGKQGGWGVMQRKGIGEAVVTPPAPP